MTTPPVLVLARAGKTHMLDKDASAYQLGCTLLQEYYDDTCKHVDHRSYWLNTAERNYSVRDRNVTL